MMTLISSLFASYFYCFSVIPICNLNFKENVFISTSRHYINIYDDDSIFCLYREHHGTVYSAYTGNTMGVARHVSRLPGNPQEVGVTYNAKRSHTC